MAVKVLPEERKIYYGRTFPSSYNFQLSSNPIERVYASPWVRFKDVLKELLTYYGIYL